METLSLDPYFGLKSRGTGLTAVNMRVNLLEAAFNFVKSVLTQVHRVGIVLPGLDMRQAPETQRLIESA